MTTGTSTLSISDLKNAGLSPEEITRLQTFRTKIQDGYWAEEYTDDKSQWERLQFLRWLSRKESGKQALLQSR